MKKFLKDNGKMIFAYLIIPITALILIGGIFFMRKMDSLDYNNGTCEKCGGHYSYDGAVGHGRNGSTTYIYKCDDCGHVIHTYEIMN